MRFLADLRTPFICKLLSGRETMRLMIRSLPKRQVLVQRVDTNCLTTIRMALLYILDSLEEDILQLFIQIGPILAAIRPSCTTQSLLITHRAFSSDQCIFQPPTLRLSP